MFTILRWPIGKPDVPALPWPFRRRRRRPQPVTVPLGPATCYTNRSGAYASPNACTERTQIHTGIAPLLTPGQQQRTCDGDR